MLTYLGRADQAVAACIRKAASAIRAGERELLSTGFQEGLYFTTACDHLLCFSLTSKGGLGFTGIIYAPEAAADLLL